MMPTKTSLLATLILCGVGCEAFEPGAATIDVPTGIQADGATLHQIELCSTMSTPVDKVSTTLTVTSGRFQPSDAESSGRVATLELTESDPCATVGWIPDTQPRLVRFEARVGTERIAVTEITTERAVITIELPVDVEADGATSHVVEICSESSSVDLSATLNVTSGVLDPSDLESSGRSATVTFGASRPCATVGWTPDNQPRVVRFSALLGSDSVASEELSTRPTTITSVGLRSSNPFLLEEGESQRTLTVDLYSDSGGGPSVGTLVTLQVLSVEPATQLAILSDVELRIGTREAATLFVAPGTSNVVVQAMLGRDDPESPRDCVTLVAPGQPNPEEGCP
jgi:hypothetical protein